MQTKVKNTQVKPEVAQDKSKQVQPSLDMGRQSATILRHPGANQGTSQSQPKHLPARLVGKRGPKPSTLAQADTTQVEPVQAKAPPSKPAQKATQAESGSQNTTATARVETQVKTGARVEYKINLGEYSNVTVAMWAEIPVGAEAVDMAPVMEQAENIVLKLNEKLQQHFAADMFKMPKTNVAAGEEIDMSDVDMGQVGANVEVETSAPESTPKKAKAKKAESEIVDDFDEPEAKPEPKKAAAKPAKTKAEVKDDFDFDFDGPEIAEKPEPDDELDLELEESEPVKPAKKQARPESKPESKVGQKIARTKAEIKAEIDLDFGEDEVPAPKKVASKQAIKKPEPEPESDDFDSGFDNDTDLMIEDAVDAAKFDDGLNIVDDNSDQGFGFDEDGVAIHKQRIGPDGKLLPKNEEYDADHLTDMSDLNLLDL